MCSRILYKTGTGNYIVGRTMDWSDTGIPVGFWVFPRGLAQNGAAGKSPIQWTSKYGSVIISGYDAGTNEGMNDKGFVANILYLAEADYGDPVQTGKPTLSVGAWGQYFLDNYATVNEAVAAMKDEPFTVVSPMLPNGRPATLHLAISDATGDSAILEYINGKLVIHHSREYTVMTNSPTFDQQLALNTYWDLIGGSKFLPGTIYSADRFVRLSYNLKSSPEYEDSKIALASVFSQIRAISTPLGMADPDHPNIAPTLWRSVLDTEAKVYYFETVLMPAVMWVDMKLIDFQKGSGVRHIPIDAKTTFAGEISAKFVPAEPFKWMN